MCTPRPVTSARGSSPAGGGFLITPTEACLGFLEPGQLAWLDAAGQQHSGLPASKTWLLHRRIYEADPLAHCIIHTHSTHLVSLTLQDPAGQGDLLPPITPYFVMKVGHVPRIAYHRPGDPRAADRVVQEMAQARAAGRRLHAVMLDRLGPNVWHSSPAQAMAVLEELEETARLWCMSSPRPPRSRRRRLTSCASISTPPGKHAPICCQPVHDVQRGALPRALCCGCGRWL